MRRPNFATTDTPLSRPLPSRIYLVGMPGSGKSAVGPPLANRLGYRFLDLDDEVRRISGRTPAELFREGEAAFREVERRALEATLRASGLVVATGGGVLTQPNALSLIMRSGAFVYLRVPVAVSVERLAGRADRPLLLDEAGAPLAAELLRRRLAVMLDAREPDYKRADFVVDAGQGSPESIADEIMARFGG
jgi:shikimate kinase